MPAAETLGAKKKHREREREREREPVPLQLAKKRVRFRTEGRLRCRMRRGVASGLVADVRVRRIRFLGWWHQTLRHLLVSGGSSFVGGSIRPSGGCSKRQVLELACIFASEPCRQGPRASLHVSPNTVLDTWIVFVRKSKQQMISVLCPVSCSTASFKHVLFVVASMARSCMSRTGWNGSHGFSIAKVWLCNMKMFCSSVH